jgi:hypothetical protein
MNNFNDEGREFIQDFFMRITFWWASAIFGLNLPLTPKLQKILNCSVFRNIISEINNWKRYDFHQNNPNFISVSAL